MCVKTQHSLNSNHYKLLPLILTELTMYKKMGTPMLFVGLNKTKTKQNIKTQ